MRWALFTLCPLARLPSNSRSPWNSSNNYSICRQLSSNSYFYRTSKLEWVSWLSLLVITMEPRPKAIFRCKCLSSIRRSLQASSSSSSRTLISIGTSCCRCTADTQASQTQSSNPLLLSHRRGRAMECLKDRCSSTNQELIIKDRAKLSLLSKRSSSWSLVRHNRQSRAP